MGYTNNVNKNSQDELKVLLKELKQDPYHNFNIAFILMSVLPLLVSMYLIASKLFTINMTCV